MSSTLMYERHALLAKIFNPKALNICTKVFGLHKITKVCPRKHNLHLSMRLSIPFMIATNQVGKRQVCSSYMNDRVTGTLVIK